MKEEWPGVGCDEQNIQEVKAAINDRTYSDADGGTCEQVICWKDKRKMI